MTLKFYTGSGSPYAWRVHLALEHKALAYETELLSFSAGDTRKPEFLALNPRGRVPLIDDGGFVLYESTAIVEYLDEAYPGRGAPLFPGDALQRATVRRLVSEVAGDLAPVVEKLLDQAFLKPEERMPDAVAAAREAVREQFGFFVRAMRGPYLAGSLSAADYTLYPYAAFLFRVESTRMPEVRAAELLPPELIAWRERIEALPFFPVTYPPHWRKA